MEVSDLIQEYDEIAGLAMHIASNEIYNLMSIHNLVTNDQESCLKQELLESTRLKLELESKLKQKEKLDRNLAGAHALLNEERSRTRQAQYQSDQMKNQIKNFQNKLKLVENIPEHIKNNVFYRCNEFETSIRNASQANDSDPSDITCSGTESDSWHLYPSHPLPKLSLCSPRVSSSSSENYPCGSVSIELFDDVFERIHNRSHEYKTKNLVLGETCGVCESRIQCGKQALKCNSCKAIVHQKCRDNLAKPCVPINIIKPGTRNLENFCSIFTPKIPGIVIHSIIYIETHGLNHLGLYSLPVYDKNVTHLKELFFKGRGVPNLSKYDVEVVSTFFKEFFALLDPPLIPHQQFQQFLTYARNPSKFSSNMDNLLEEFLQLPCPNRDTLAYLILHFQKIASSSEVKMNSYRLSKTFAPILIENYDFKDLKREKLYRKVIQNFIEMSPDFWKRILMKSV